MSLGLLPSDWLLGPSHVPWITDLATLPDASVQRYRGGVFLAMSRNHQAVIGVTGFYAGLKMLVKRFGSDAAHCYFPYPPCDPSSAQDNDSGVLMMVFDIKGLRRAQIEARRADVIMRDHSG